MARHKADPSRVDDRPEERESPVRHAHAVAARRHGRASTPGYLGVPLDEVEPGERADLERTDSGQQDDDESSGAGRRDDESSGEGRRDDESSGEGRRGRRSPRARSSAKGERSDKPERSERSKRSQVSASAREGHASARATSGDRAPSSQGGGSRTSKTRASKGSTSKARSASKKPKGVRRPSSSATEKASGASKAGARRSSASRSASSAKTGAKKASGRSQAAARKRTAKRAGPVKRAGAAKRGAASAASTVKSKVASAVDLGEAALQGGGKSLPRHLLAKLARRMLIRGARAVARAGASSVDALAARARSLPIQVSIDVAVPADVAWEQWAELCYFPEGAHRVTNVKRDGEWLSGQLTGASSRDWEAEVIDERENESFAWRSTEGSDSAGLVTFHELSDRLTRIELTLDVVPVDLPEAAALAVHLADRRVKAELRRFKAHVELLNPDTYHELVSSQNGAGDSG